MLTQFYPFLLVANCTRSLLASFHREFSLVKQNSWGLSLLHGIPDSICISNFRACFKVSLHSLSYGFMCKRPLSLHALSSFGFSSVHWCFSFCWYFFDIPDQSSGHTCSGLDVASSPLPDHVYLWRCVFCKKKTNCVKPIHCAESILPASTFPKSSIRHSCDTSNVVCVRLTTSMICERAFLWHTQFFFLEHDQDKWGFLTYARNHVLLPIRLVLVVALQNLVLLFLLEDQSGVLLLFDILVGCSEFWTFSCQLCGTVNKWEYEFVSFVRHRNFFLLSFNSKTHRLRRSPVIPQRQLRVRLRSSFLPHGERISTPKKMRRLSCRTDGASPDLPLISGGIRLLLRKKYAWPIHMTFCPLMVHLGHCASSNDVP